MGLGITDAVELSGRVVDLVKKGITIELQERVMQLREAVLNTKDEVLELREQSQRLREQITEKEDWEGRTTEYELVTTSGGAIVYQYLLTPSYYACPTCFEARRISILQRKSDVLGTCRCLTCNYDFRINPSRPPPTRGVISRGVY